MRAVLLRLTIWCVLCAFSNVTIRDGQTISDPRKNEERKKKRALLVSLPRASLVMNMPHGILLSSPLPTPSEQIHMTPSLLISLPVSSFLCGPILSAVQLGMRLSKIPLPPPWVLTPLVLCNVTSHMQL